MFLLYPTKDQKEILSSSSSFISNKKTVKIIAQPGTGKSALLKELVYTNPHYKFLCLTFSNEAAQSVGKDMPQNCHTHTLHKFAKDAIAGNSRVITKYSPSNIQNMFNGISFGQALQVRKLLEKYLQSSAIALSSMEHSASKKTEGLCKELLSRMWKREIPITLNYFLKEFYLEYRNKPFPGGYDCILIDEYQDNNELMCAIYENIGGCSVLSVGDPNQSINGFMGAKNAISDLKTDITYTLSENFRSSKNVIDKANDVLVNIMGESKTIVATLTPRKELRETAIITRTNAELAEYVEFYDKFHLVKGSDALFNLPITVARWLKGENVGATYGHLNKIKSEEELKKYISDSGDVSLGSAYKLAKRLGYKSLVNLKNIASTRSKGTSVKKLLTAHASKGLQYRKVRLGGDFPSLLKIAKKVESGEKDIKELEEECRLYFVAITRASEEVIDETPNSKLGTIDKLYIKDTIQRRKAS